MTFKNDKNHPYGFLNPLNSQYGAGKATLDPKVFNFMESLQSIVKDRYQNDFLANNTQYKAIVLRVLDDDQFGGSPQIESLNANSGISTNITRIIAKIPELHAHLPDPESEDDFLILGMYPIFMLAKAQLKGAIKALENDKGLHEECDFELERKR